jgi:hypothetical protein
MSPWKRTGALVAVAIALAVFRPDPMSRRTATATERAGNGGSRVGDALRTAADFGGGAIVGIVPFAPRGHHVFGHPRAYHWGRQLGAAIGLTSDVTGLTGPGAFGAAAIDAGAPVPPSIAAASVVLAGTAAVSAIGHHRVLADAVRQARSVQ